jgi:uroporphyrinogen III methyltransferase/synthase
LAAPRKPDWITFTSSSTVKNFVKLLGSDYLKQLQNVKLASIGPVTTKTAKERWLEIAVEAEQHTIPGLVAAILEM